MDNVKEYIELYEKGLSDNISIVDLATECYLNPFDSNQLSAYLTVVLRYLGLLSDDVDITIDDPLYEIIQPIAACACFTIEEEFKKWAEAVGYTDDKTKELLDVFNFIFFNSFAKLK